LTLYDTHVRRVLRLNDRAAGKRGQSMKKVRYALGAVGVAPALGLAIPHADAGTTHHSTAARTLTKTVSLRHSGLDGCTGSTEATKTGSFLKLTFWHTFHPAFGTSCIGTVETKVSGTAIDQPVYDRVRIYSDNGGKHLQYHHYSGASKALNGKTFTDGVHQSFFVPIQVCTAIVSNPNKSLVFLGPVCKSVG
jgi:hypothetical protein